MKIRTLVSVLALAAQGLAISDRLDISDAISVTTVLPSAPWSDPRDTESTLSSIVDYSTSESSSASLSASTATSLTGVSSINASSEASPLVPRVPWAGVTRTGHWNIIHFGWWIPNSVLDDLPWHAITHIVYSYARVAPDGSVIPGNPEADERNILKINRIKRHYRHVKLFYAIGPRNRIGPYESVWDPQFDIFRTTQPFNKPDALRDRFAQTAMGLLQDWGCDGVVVDWSFPEDNKDQYFNLIHTLRMVLDQFEVDFCNVEVMEAGLEGNLARRCRFWVCLGLGWEGLDVWHNIHAIDKIVDVWFYRGHDYSGPWSNTSMHHANLRGKESDSIARNTSMDLNTFFDRGIFPRKVILGLPMYGRSFIQESTEFGSEFNDSGIVFYKDIDPSWDCGFDNHLAAAWCHDGTRLISYDNPSTVKVKTLWAMQDGLAGLSFTPAFGDKPGFDSLLHAAWEQMPTFDGSPSRINFPRSKYPQIRGLLDPQKDFPA